MADELPEIKQLLTKKPALIPQSDFLSTGSTLLNLASSGTTYGGFVKGKYFYFVGDSNSGKTFLSLTCFAEACRNRHFDNYDLIFDDVENGALMDLDKFFGKKVSQRIKSPSTYPDGRPRNSETIQDFYYHLALAKKKNKPVVYVLDSMDSLSSVQEKQKQAEHEATMVKHYSKKDDGEGDLKLSGSYGDGKAKVNSEKLRGVVNWIRKTKSILIIISQTRDNLQPMSYEKKTRSGGKSLTFYACMEMWTAQAGHIVKKQGEKKYELGINSQIRIRKNRICGKDRTVTVPILHSFGIDDVGSCVDYLVTVKWWKKSGQVTAPEINFKGYRNDLIKYIEDNELEDVLYLLVQKAWDREEEKTKVERKRRYE